jgi:hypothetical protein
VFFSATLVLGRLMEQAVAPSAPRDGEQRGSICLRIHGRPR